MRLFISYAHVDNFQVAQIVDILRSGGHDPWFDHRLLPGQDWKDTLFQGIRQCEAFVYIMSPESLASEWCQWEFARAVEMGKPIIPVRLQTNVKPPDTLSRFQWVDFSDGATGLAVAKLLGGLHHAAAVPKDRIPDAPENPSGVPAQAGPSADAQPLDVNSAIEHFYAARNAGKWTEGLGWLNKIKATGQAPRTFKLDDMLAEMQGKLNAEHEYQSIKVMAKHEPPAAIWTALEEIWKIHPGYDPDGLYAKYRSHAPEIRPLLDMIQNANATPPERAEAGRKLAELGDPRPGVGLRPDGLPDLDWVEIPGGDFIYGDDRIMLPTFYITRYLITYSQFQAFVDDPDGYENEGWWKGLALRDAAFHEPQWPLGNHPRECVSWLQSMAFCRWLTAKLGFKNKIMLPTDQQWEKAARGPSGREFPWGDEYISGYANINETYQDENHQASGTYALERTTAVGIYPQGVSYYGVMDMMGNVWEWCLTDFETGDNDDLTTTNQRISRGGSWDSVVAHARLTSYNRAGPGYWGDSLGFRACVAKLEQ